MTLPRARWWLTPALCLLLAIVHTWPLATAPGTLSRNDNGDTQLNEWILAWVAHQLPIAPARLFDANIFYPARDTLAFSEPLIVPALMGAPMQWLGATPVLVFNVLLIAGFALTAWAGSALVESWTGERVAGLLAGSMFAFNTHTLTRLAHIQGIHAWGLPLALLSADRIITRALLRDTVALAGWMAAMAYTSGYLLVFASVMIAVVIVARLTDVARRPGRILAGFGLAAALAVIASFPIYIPYHRVARDQGMVRSLESVSDFSATPKGYLAAAGRIHFHTWSGGFFRDPVDSFFPGVVVLVLAALAVWRAFSRREESEDHAIARRRVVMLAGIAVTGFVLSLGTRTPAYGWLFQVFPPMQGLRAAARFGNLFLLGMAALAGIGLAGTLRRMASRRALLLGVALATLANLESLRAPFEYTRFDGIPAIYSLLAHEPGRVVLVEAPFYPPQAVFENAGYVLASTAHWRPLMNGYSGYIPASYRTYAASFWFFPEDSAVQEMRRAGVTHVMVHPQRFYQDAQTVMNKITASPYLERIAIGRNGDILYRLH
jgi:hypothetical protein